ncbi:hypothetical protein BCR36DRAFT_156406 [Piromyces finnis]|uniref:Scaffoldin n=1 Tax=Piromyces finnis TaxID=1754191 RepID=A0A1Y1UWQ0_9FUNG|nr:hypothetical protein BCR36DRAFT_156406 [Piromyces finnis]|eukprot:ORX42609.1 hypothetical protein BCR36DRAFT_156406 [Piromyces finnis]
MDIFIMAKHIKISVYRGILFLIVYLFSFVNAGIEILPCPEKINITNVNCLDESDAIADSYCLKGSYIYSLRQDGSSICYNKFNNMGNNIIKLNENSIEFLNFNSISISENDISNIAIISCNTNKSVTCLQTSGIIKDKDSKFYGISKNNSIPNYEMNISNTSCISNVGNLITFNETVRLCLSESIHIPLANFEENDAYYIMDNINNTKSPFFNNDISDEKILIKSFPNYFINSVKVFDNVYVDYNTYIITKNVYKGIFLDKCFNCIYGICSGQKTIETNSYLFKYDLKSSVTYGYIYTLTNVNNGTVISEIPMEPSVRAFIINEYFDYNNYTLMYTDSYNYNVGVMIKDEQFMDKSLNESILYRTNLFYCHSGICSTTQGFIKYLDSVSNTIMISSCDSMCKPITNVYNSCNTQYSVYYDIGLEKFFYCSKPIHKNEILPIDLTTKDKPLSFLVEYGNSSVDTEPTFFLLLTDKNGNCIGYSNTNNSGLLFDSNNDGKNEFLKCNNRYSGSGIENEIIQCTHKDNFNGYIINALGKNNEVIFCQNNQCKITSVQNGYFLGEIGSLNERVLIKCRNTQCSNEKQIESDETNICYGINGQVVLSTNNKARYCNEGNAIKLQNNDNYFTLMNVNARKTYPLIEPGNDVIILKVSKYSVTQLITTDSGNKKKFYLY